MLEEYNWKRLCPHQGFMKIIFGLGRRGLCCWRYPFVFYYYLTLTMHPCAKKNIWRVIDILVCNKKLSGSVPAGIGLRSRNGFPPILANVLPWMSDKPYSTCNITWWYSHIIVTIMSITFSLCTYILRDLKTLQPASVLSLLFYTVHITMIQLHRVYLLSLIMIIIVKEFSHYDGES
jgi:hypothetical protein